VAFDESYYQRFYYNRRTAVTSPRENAARAKLIAAGVNYLNLPVRRILDAGCGIGMLRAPLLKEFKNATYTGLEVSHYLCEKYGWVETGIQDFRSRAKFDLVVCYDVFQYLDEREARRGFQNLEKVCRGVLYFGVLTQEDWDQNCVQSQTDEKSILRPDAWYRCALSEAFQPLGLGLWVSRETPVSLWSLESA
jgi:SAM-dependent methyltransferase